MNNEKILKVEKMPVIERAVLLLNEYLGEFSAKEYREFYTGKDDLLIITSLREILEEMIGPKKTDELIRDNFDETNSETS